MSDLRVPRLVELGGAPLAASRIGEVGAGITTEIRAEAFAASASLAGHELAEIRGQIQSLCGPPAAHGKDWCAFRLPWAILLARGGKGVVELHLEPYGQTKPLPTFEPDVASWLAERRATTTRVVTPTILPPGDSIEPVYKVFKGGRLAESESLRQLVRWLVELAAGPLTAASVHALVQREKFRPMPDDRHVIPDTRTELIVEHKDDTLCWLMAWLGRQSKPGSALDKLFAGLAKDVAAELGKPEKLEKSRWAVHRTGGALVIVAAQGDWLRQYGEAVSLVLLPWPPDQTLPELGASAETWLEREMNRRSGH